MQFWWGLAGFIAGLAAGLVFLVREKSRFRQALSGAEEKRRRLAAASAKEVASLREKADGALKEGISISHLRWSMKEAALRNQIDGLTRQVASLTQRLEAQSGRMKGALGKAARLARRERSPAPCSDGDPPDG